MFQVIAIDTLKTVELIPGYEEATSFCVFLERMGKHCSELMFIDAWVDTNNEMYEFGVQAYQNGNPK